MAGTADTSAMGISGYKGKPAAEIAEGWMVVMRMSGCGAILRREAVASFIACSMGIWAIPLSLSTQP